MTAEPSDQPAATGVHSWFSLVFSRFALASCSPGEVDAVGNAITLHLQQDAKIELG